MHPNEYFLKVLKLRRKKKKGGGAVAKRLIDSDFKLHIDGS